jgi:hypothetical protein
LERSPRKPLAALTSDELHQRAVEYRGMAANARGAVATALERLSTRYGLLATQRQLKEAATVQDLHSDSCGQTELAKLVALVNRAAECEPNPARCLVTTIRATVASNADPYLVIGILLEGAVHTVCSRIPHMRRQDTANALLRLLKDRLEANGL